MLRGKDARCLLLVLRLEGRYVRQVGMPRGTSGGGPFIRSGWRSSLSSSSSRSGSGSGKAGGGRKEVSLFIRSLWVLDQQKHDSRLHAETGMPRGAGRHHVFQVRPVVPHAMRKERVRRRHAETAMTLEKHIISEEEAHTLFHSRVCGTGQRSWQSS